MADPIFDLGLQGGADPYYQAAPVNPAAVEAPLAPPPISIDPNRGGSISDVPMNAVKDAADIAKGMYQVAALPIARLFEATSGNGGLFRESDITEFGKFTADIIDQYKTTYLDPVLQGRPLDILQYGVEHPIQAAGDWIPALKVAGVGKIAGKAASIAGKSEALAKAGETAKMLYGQLETKAPAIFEAIETARTDQQFFQPLRKELVDTLNNQERAALIESWKAVPAAEQGVMSRVLEGTLAQKLSQQGQAFVDLYKPFVKRLGDRILSDGLVSAAEIEMARWIPATLQKFGGAVNDYDPQTFARMVEAVKKELTAQGIDPAYVPWMSQKQVQSVLNRAPWSISDRLTKAAIANKEAGQVVDQPGFAKARKGTGEGYHDNPLELALARDTESWKYHLFFRKLMDRAIQLGTSADEFTKLPFEKQAGLVPFNLHEFYKEVVGGVVEKIADKETLAATLPEVVYMPRTVARALKNVRSGSSGPAKFIQYANGFAKKYMLGLNPLFPEKNYLNNETMLFVSQWQGPQDIAKTVASHILAMNPEVRKAIPAHLLNEDVAGKLGSGAGMLPTPVGKVIDKLADKNLARAAKYDQLSRAKAIIYYALHLSEKLGHKKLIGEICSAGDAINRIQGVANDSAAVVELSRRVNQVCGDYSQVTMRTGWRKYASDSFMWYSWWEHATRFAFALPARNPYKTSIMNHLAQVAPVWFEDEAAPEYLRQAGAVRIQGKTNPQGLPEYVTASSLSPFGTVPELLQMIHAPFNEYAGDGAGLYSSVNPLFSVLYALIFHKNPQSLRDFSNPDLVKFQGRQYKPEDIAAGKQDIQEVHPVPNPIELVGRQTFSWPVRAAERIYTKATADAEPSQFTAPIAGQAAPKRVSSLGYEPMAADNWGDIALQIFLGFRAMPIDDQAEMMRQMYEPKQQQQMQRSYMRQFGSRQP